VQATVHLTHYSLHLQMALLALLILPIMLSFSVEIGIYRSTFFLMLLLPAAAGPSMGYLVCQYFGRPESWKRRALRLPFLLILGFGISLSNARAVIDGLISNDSTFVRTPKDGERKLKKYALGRTKLPLFEVLFAGYCALTVGILLYLGQYALIPFVVIYTLGFTLVGFKSLREARA
jgi:hypothetical protein